MLEPGNKNNRMALSLKFLRHAESESIRESTRKDSTCQYNDRNCQNRFEIYFKH